MNSFIVFSALGSLLALVFAVLMGKRALSADEGTDQMRKIASFIRDGANAYLRRQYSVVIAFFGIMFVILCVMSAFGYLTWFVPFAFVTGGFFSGFSGFIGMKIATASNARTANACRTGLNAGLRIAFSAGTVMGFTVVGLGLLDVSAWYILLKYVFKLPLEDITAAMLTFGMGASSMALFARVGGGIFTKAADVGADLVGKVEAGIPEDDARNPAAIADNVGDNVGDVAGMGADLYESYVGSLISACSLGVIAFNHIAAVDRLYAFAVPLLLAAIGVVASILGSLLVRTGESTEQMSLLKALRRGTNTAAILIAVAALPLVWLLLGKNHLGLYAAILAGLISGVLIGRFTEYYTSDTYRPTKHLAEASETGTATLVIDGISLGMKSTILPVVVVGICILISYYVSGIGAPEDARNAMGLYGIALAAVGMLSTLGITLATDAYGPVADNAGGIAEMSGLPEEVRQRTDALDSLGNTTAATGKGFAIGSASLTALALLVSYVDIVQSNTTEVLDLSLTNPLMLVGLFIGAMLTFVFSAFTMSAVQKAAQSIVVEVRRQFRSIPGIMEYEADPDYASCVALCTKGALHEMVAPALLAIIVPILTGLVLGPIGVVGLLGGVSVTGFAMAVFMSNAGGAWDNAKKYIESGHHGGKGSDQHKAAVVGDTVGDPFKDTSGPSLNILIKLCSTVSIVFSGLILAFNLMNIL